MVKAKEFWKYLCEKLGYKFFTGVPCYGLKNLYDAMSSKIMHYVPAVKEDIAVGLASGVSLSGIKSCILLDANRINIVMNWLVSFNLAYKLPPLIVVYKDCDCIGFEKTLKHYKIPYRNFAGELKNLRFIINKIEKLSIPGVCIIGEGEISK